MSDTKDPNEPVLDPATGQPYPPQGGDDSGEKTPTEIQTEIQEAAAGVSDYPATDPANPTGDPGDVVDDDDDDLTEEDE